MVLHYSAADVDALTWEDFTYLTGVLEALEREHARELAKMEGAGS